MIRPRLYRSLCLPALRLSGHVFRVAVPLCLVIPILAACHIFVDDVEEEEQEPCVQTHDQGCLSEPEFQALVEEIAGEYAEPSSFQNQWGLAAINADQAYANLELEFGPDVAPGEGITVGLLDTGIDGADPAFRDKTVVERFLGANDEDGSEFSHGTAVASILAGEDIPGFPHDAQGVAWGADLVVFAIPLGDPPEFYEPTQISELPGTAKYFAETFEEILAWRFGSRSIDFLNLSLGVSGIIENYSEEIVRESFSPLLPVMLQEGANEKVVFVWAGGNTHGLDCDIPVSECVDGAVEATSASLLSGLGAHIPELQETLVAVVAIRPDGEIAEFSNRCGIAAEYCLAAPGDDLRFSYFGPGRDGTPGFRGIGVGGGTSFAAPMVTGGLAVMKQYFRGQISNTDLLSRLLETANSSGIYADSAIYGRGLMDLGAATSPVGETVVVMGDRVDSSGAALNDSVLQLGLAFGDALIPALEDREIAAFDQLGAPFWYDVDSMVNVAARPALHDRYRDFQQLSLSEALGSPARAIRLPILEARGKPHGAAPGLYLARTGAPASSNANHFALARHSIVATLPVAANLSATLLTAEGLARQEPASGAALTWREPEAPFGLRAGWMGERDTLLGSESDGAFGDLEAHAAFAGIEADTELGSWRLGGTAEIGTVNAQARGGVFQEISPLATSAFALHATRQNSDGSAFRVSLSQPLRVERGQALLALPSGRTRAGEVIRNTLNADVEPGGRQVDLALQWHQPLELGELRLGATLSHEPGHRKNADAELILLSGWRHFF